MAESKTKKEQTAQEVAVIRPDQVDPAAEAEAILAEARRKAEEIVAAAKEEAQTIQVPAQAQGESDDDLVTIQLFRDNDKYKNDVFVAVNGQSCLIQRGKPVQIKRKFARVLEQSMNQDILASELMDREEKEFERQSKLYDI